MLVWFRRDLRVQDNPALMQTITDAREKGPAVEAVYLHSPDDEGNRSIGESPIAEYETHRDRPDVAGISRAKALDR